MKSKLIITISAIALASSCSSHDVSIGNDMFIHNNKIYKVIDNEPRELGDLNSNVKKFEVSKPTQRDLGTQEVGYWKKGATVSMTALYRGNFLYFNLKINGVNDLRENYSYGAINIEFIDEYGFILHSTEIAITDLTGEVDANNQISYYVYSGKTEMSTDINSAIKGYEITSTITHK